MRCPTCRRIIEEQIECPRCGTGLQALRELRDAARRLTVQGRHFLRAGEARKAEQAFRAAEHLCHSETAEKGIAVALLCRGKFAEALARARRCR